MKDDPQWETNSDARLHPDSIAKAYKYLVEQDSSALTWELDRECHHQRDGPDLLLTFSLVSSSPRPREVVNTSFTLDDTMQLCNNHESILSGACTICSLNRTFCFAPTLPTIQWMSSMPTYVLPPFSMLLLPNFACPGDHPGV